MKPNFYKSNIARLKSLGQDCPQCIQDKQMCHHYDYLRDYIKELETTPPVDGEKFNMFWAAYPNKKARKAALKVWERLEVTDELFEKIMKAVEQHKLTRQWKEGNGQFVPHPTTWLNQERWEDEVQVAREIESDTIQKSDLYKTLVSWAEHNSAYQMERTIERWIERYGEYTVRGVMKSNENSFHNFMVDMGKMGKR